MQDPIPIETRKAAAGPQPDPRRALVHRVASSPTFQKSNRLRELLVFLCERALAVPGVIIHEQEIGMEVFGRPAAYDTSQDTLVRVQASQLRKKLQQYFASEGLQEPIVIEIPKGAYTPVFCGRQPESAEDRSPEVREPSSRPPRVNRLTVLFACLAIVSSAMSLWLAFRHTDSGGTVRSGSESRPTVDRLWRQFFANGRPTCLVISDSNLTLFEDMIRRHVDLNDYKKKNFSLLADELLADPQQREFGKTLMSRFFTSIADANLAGKFGALGSAQVPLDIVFARDFGMSYLQSQNVILLGSRRANPWLELFEDELNFRTGFEEQPRTAYFRNHSPLPGEKPEYRVVWESEGYCRVAFLPNLTGNGNVLLISGTDLASTDAGGEFITSERWVEALRSRLGLSGSARFPHFEALLKVQLLVAAAPKFEIAAHRVLK